MKRRFGPLSANFVQFMEFCTKRSLRARSSLRGDTTGMCLTYWHENNLHNAKLAEKFGVYGIIQLNSKHFFTESYLRAYRHSLRIFPVTPVALGNNILVPAGKVLVVLARFFIYWVLSSNFVVHSSFSS